MIRTTLLAALLAAPAAASTAAQWSALDDKATTACKAAATEVKDPQIGPAVRFSDAFGVELSDSMKGSDRERYRTPDF